MNASISRFPRLRVAKACLLVALTCSVSLASGCTRKCRNGTVLVGDLCRPSALNDTAGSHQPAEGSPEVASAQAIDPASASVAAAGTPAVQTTPAMQTTPV